MQLQEEEDVFSNVFQNQYGILDQIGGCNAQNVCSLQPLLSASSVESHAVVDFLHTLLPHEVTIPHFLQHL